MKSDNINKRKSYHRFFEGYTEYSEQHGHKSKIIRIYTDPYMKADISDQCYFVRKIEYAILSIASVTLFVFSSAYATPANSSRIIAVTQALALVML
jgi:hypothetical protein